VQHIFENWRRYLGGLPLDESRVRDVAKRSRKIVDYILKNLKERLAEFSDDATGEDIFGSKARKTFTNYEDEVDVAYEFKDPKTGKQQVINIVANYGTHPDVTPEEVFSPGGGFASWEQQKEWGESYTDTEGADYLLVKLRFAPSISKKDIVKNLQKIYMGLLDSTSHELEHQTQSSRGELPTEIIMSQDMGAYLMQPHEIEAFSRGLYTIAVKTKAPFEQLVEEAATRIQILCSRSSAEQDCSDEVFENFKNAVLQYAKQQLPCAQDKERDLLLAQVRWLLDYNKKEWPLASPK